MESTEWWMQVAICCPSWRFKLKVRPSLSAEHLSDVERKKNVLLVPFKYFFKYKKKINSCHGSTHVMTSVNDSYI